MQPWSNWSRMDDAEIKYSTVQNWYPGDKDGKGGIYNFVTKRGDCRGDRSKISLDAGRDRLGHHLEIPVLHPARRRQPGEFYSIAVSNGHQQVDSGTKMIHLGKNTSSRIIAKGISAGVSETPIAARSRLHRKATNARNFTQCDSLLIGDKCGAHTVPYIEAKNSSANSSTRRRRRRFPKTSCSTAMQRGIPGGGGIALIVNGFVRDVIQQLPMEFAVEAQKLIGISLEGSVG
ncbi:MAG: SufD family Fe-S cluster assembly protein [Rhizobium sp.]|nr:SufD family Fe-S cluster assembly protein [Rhizobium sp.]